MSSAISLSCVATTALPRLRPCSTAMSRPYALSEEASCRSWSVLSKLRIRFGSLLAYSHRNCELWARLSSRALTVGFLARRVLSGFSAEFSSESQSARRARAALESTNFGAIAIRSASIAPLVPALLGAARLREGLRFAGGFIPQSVPALPSARQ